VATHALPQPSPGLEHPSSGTPALPTTVGAQARAQRRAAAIGSAALAGLLAAMALLAIATASVSSDSVAEAGPHFFPAWLAGPLHGLGLDVSTRGLELVIVAICACYLVALRYATAISSRRLWGTIVLAHLAAALAPPLFSGDVFGYIGFARLDVLHGLSPYVHTAAAAPHDAIYHLLGWTTLTTPYGPLFTLLSDALVPAGIAGGLWTFKALAALASLATVLLIWRAAPRIGRSQRSAIAFYGLNPIVLVFAIPGAHNEALIGMFVAAGALCILSGSELRGGVSLVAASAIKASAALALPFALLGAPRRGRAATGMAIAAVAVAAIAVIAFGPHLFGLAGALLTQQEKVAGHSVPAEISQLLGLGQLALGVRIVFLALFGGVLVATLWRTWRGSHWLVSYGWTTLALLAATVWLVPWYGLWALLPASLGPSRRLRVATLIACAYLVAMRLAVQNPLSAG
jgi:alpha-1,6-mannosyltransferase